MNRQTDSLPAELIVTAANNLESGVNFNEAGET